MSVIAIGTICIAVSGCAEIELGAEIYKGIPRASGPPTVRPIAQSSAHGQSIDPALRSDPEAFFATGLALWNGSQTLQGVWVAHPSATIARRVRLTNKETGAQADAAMFRRDPNLSGPQIIVSSDAATLLGLTEGHGTQITIAGLAYRTEDEIAVESDNVADASAASDGLDIDLTNPRTIGVRATESDLPNGPEPSSAGTEPGDPAATVATVATVAREGETTSGAGSSNEDDSGEHAAPAPIASAPGSVLPPRKPKFTPTGATPREAEEILDGRYFVQAGVFSRTDNATRLVEILRAANLLANALPIMLGEKQFTRVLVGPYYNIAERNTALEIVRQIGAADAVLARG
jgi:cell division septation protein DedD